MKSVASVVLVLLVFGLPVAAGDLKDDLLSREKVLWQAWGDKDGAPFLEQATEDYVQAVAGVGMVVGRDAVAKDIASHSCVVSSFQFSDARLRQPSPDVAILTYVATQDTKCDGAALPARVFATSIWVKKDGKWMTYSYQETPID